MAFELGNSLLQIIDDKRVKLHVNRINKLEDENIKLKQKIWTLKHRIKIYSHSLKKAKENEELEGYYLTENCQFCEKNVACNNIFECQDCFRKGCNTCISFCERCRINTCVLCMNDNVTTCDNCWLNNKN